LEEVPGGIFEKECVVLDPGAGEPDARLLVKRQPLGFGLIGLAEVLISTKCHCSNQKSQSIHCGNPSTGLGCRRCASSINRLQPV
ncbi:MAG: hypothetical protein ABIU05_27410, partial [Nitrospirales bacterium]